VPVASWAKLPFCSSPLASNGCQVPFGQFSFLLRESGALGGGAARQMVGPGGRYSGAAGQAGNDQ